MTSRSDRLGELAGNLRRAVNFGDPEGSRFWLDRLLAEIDVQQRVDAELHSRDERALENRALLVGTVKRLREQLLLKKRAHATTIRDGVLAGVRVPGTLSPIEELVLMACTAFVETAEEVQR